MLIFIALAAIISAVFWRLSTNSDAKKIFLVVFLAAVAMFCFSLFGPML